MCRVPRPRFLPLALTATVAALSVALCSCSSTAGSAAGAPPAAAAGAGGDAPRMTQQEMNARPRAELRQGGTLTWAIDQYSTQWNPVQADGSEASTNDVVKALLPTFWRSDAGGVQTPNPAYLTDVRSELQQGKQVVVWTLNPKAHWSDGTPITWRDLRANWQALGGQDPAYKTATTNGFDQVESVVRGQDDYQAVMTFKEPYSEWQAMFNNAGNAPLLPERYVSTPELFNTSFKNRIPVTAGPFKVGSMDPKTRTVTAVADPGWWGDKPLLDKIVFRAYDTGAMPEAFAKGEVDFYNNGPNTEGYKLIRSTPGGEVRRAGGPNLRQLVLNGRSPLLEDARVRQALIQAIDRAEITRTDLAGLDWPYVPMNNHFLVPSQHGYQDNSNGLSRFDPDAARATLDSLGWKAGPNGVRGKDGKELVLRYVAPAANNLAANESEEVTRMLAAVGVTVQVQTVPAGEYFDGYVYKHDFDLTSFSLLGTPFPVSNSISTFQQDSGSNWAQVGSKALDKAMADAAKADTVDDETAALNRADTEAWQVAGLVPLYQRPAIYGVRKELANIGATGLGDVVYENIGLTK
ncbi:peptide/nickel transport system substrate-binding protein [Kitasatospora cineracea]|uniref:Peptide/nickel transport system substrate-binding protein n=1 Tax=Kitasatospora cineracea TaxID=88074 RepID=A0A3N4RJ73_9ACTN|nr:peptide/nickel transport system substrate-binding protein [Kitasatospora cineracea]